MNCPVCTDPMIILEFNDVELDYCDSCSGVWLDAGELELLIGDYTASHELLSSLKSVETPEKKVPCPRCNKKMEKVGAGTKSEVTIDRCNGGHGLWFDKGEIRALILSHPEGLQSEIVKQLNDLFGNSINP